MPLEIQLEDVTGELRVGSKPQAVIRYRVSNAGHVEDCVQASTDKRGHIDQARYSAELWGRLLLGWDGIFDTKGKPVLFKCPAEVLARVRAQVKEQGLKLSDDAIAARAQGEWCHAVMRGFPASVKAALQLAVNTEKDQVAEALGN